jgi:A/G-specific adenine glycosylase
VLPNSAKELEKLSGIGRSTAHAVACFAFQEALPILDANVKRILYRFFAIEKCNDKILWEKSYELFDKHNAYIYNQTMMDIGSAICTHKNPNCMECPLEFLCKGKSNPLKYPEKKVTKKKPTKKHFMLIYHQNKTYALTQNNTKLLGGLWGFEQQERFDIEKKDVILGKFTHHYTHFRLDAIVVLVHKKTEQNYFTIEEINKLALSGADRKALAMIEGYFPN